MKWPKLGVSDSSISDAGYGLFALETIPKDTLVGVYFGELIPVKSDSEQYNKRVFYNKYGASSYVFDVRRTIGQDSESFGFVDAQRIGNLMRYANHKSADQNNVDVVLTNYEGQMKIMFWSKKKIKEEEEIFIDYGRDFFKNSK